MERNDHYGMTTIPSWVSWKIRGKYVRKVRKSSLYKIHIYIKDMTTFWEGFFVGIFRRQKFRRHEIERLYRHLFCSELVVNILPDIAVWNNFIN